MPLELGYSSSLTDIDLGQNLLTGSLSPSIWRLVSLRIHGNALSGSLPAPGYLTLLDLGDNKFSGLFAEFITRFRNVKVVDLSHNMFTGVIPDDVAQLQLDKLNLS